MLFEVMLYCRNFFPVPGGCKSGNYTISDGCISLDFLQEGQYFLVEGSVFNDGVYQYPSYAMFDETFEGTITPLAVPKAFLSLVKEIEAWNGKYGKTENLSPYISESFGGYSYSKATSSQGNAANATWQDTFKTRLKIWRCI